MSNIEAGYLVSGLSSREEYEADGRTDVRASAAGIQHSKYIRNGCDICLGSCNFTTSSRCNLELNASISSTEEAERFLYEREKMVLLKAELLSNDSRANSRSRSRSSESRGAGRRLDCHGTDHGRAREEGSDDMSMDGMTPNNRERYRKMTMPGRFSRSSRE